jgi:hypothetical protein
MTLYVKNRKHTRARARERTHARAHTHTHHKIFTLLQAYKCINYKYIKHNPISSNISFRAQSDC